MFKILIWKEIREHLMTFRFAAALVTTFFLIVVSVWVLADDYILRRTTFNRLSDESARDAISVTTPSEITIVLHYLPSPLSIFVQGAETHLGNSIEVNRWEVPSETSDYLTENVLVSAHSSFDYQAIFSIVISLFGVLLTYDSVTGERENKTLTQILANSISRATLYTAKFIAGVIVLFVPWIISFLSALLVLQFVHGIIFTSAQWLALGGIILVGVLFCSIFVAFGMFGSSLFKKSSTSLVFALLIWALGIMIIPSVAENLSSWLHKVPPQIEINNFAQTTYKEIYESSWQYFRENRVAPLQINGSFGSDNIANVLNEGNPAAFELFTKFTLFSEPLWRERAEKIWDLVQRHEAEMEKQVELANMLSIISPAVHLREAFTSLADTSYKTSDRFTRHARRVRERLLSTFQQKGYFGQNATLFFSRLRPEIALSEQKYKERKEDYSKGEEFVREKWFEPLPADLIPQSKFESGIPQFKKALFPIANLTIILIVLFMCGYMAFNRYDVR